MRQFKLNASVDLQNQRAVISLLWVLRITSHYCYWSVCFQQSFVKLCVESRPRTGASPAHCRAAGGKGLPLRELQPWKHLRLQKVVIDLLPLIQKGLKVKLTNFTL